MKDILSQATFFDFASLQNTSQILQKRFPFLHVSSIGNTVLGRPIITYTLGEGDPATLYVGGVHALEYITSALLVHFTAQLCACMQNRMPLHTLQPAEFFKRHSAIILPMLNPDGVEIHLHGAKTAGILAQTVEKLSGGDTRHWQANARGIDLNHNFDAGYTLLKKEEVAQGITQPGPGKFGGYRPESETETSALCNLCRQIPFEKVMAFHSQGEELYWHYGPNTPPYAEKMAHSLAKSATYTACSPSGMAAHGGFKDWFIQTTGRPGFTIEVGKGKNPLPFASWKGIYKRIEPLMALGIHITP